MCTLCYLGGDREPGMMCLLTNYMRRSSQKHQEKIAATWLVWGYRCGRSKVFCGYDGRMEGPVGVLHVCRITVLQVSILSLPLSKHS